VIQLVIPDPSLVVLVAAAGAGKTTFARRHFEPTEILSSDAFRARIAGDEADQRATRAAFRGLHRALEQRLAERRLTVIDATNVERSARLALLSRARTAGLPAVAVVLDYPEATILSRNAGRRARVVDERVVLHHLARLRASLDGPGRPLEEEGFLRVDVFRDPLAVDSLVVVRAPAEGSTR
jgi:protein phosphatase